jgi:hypothetical protein
MNHSQWYIGAPNGVILCIDQVADGCLGGILYHSYSTEGIAFGNAEQMTLEMEKLYDELQFPHPGTNERSFISQKQEPTQPHVWKKPQERKKIMSDENLLSKHGDLGTFIVRVQHRQNSSWQGRITWMEQNKTICFRSVWEMIKLIESAVDTVSVQEEETEEEADWFSEEKK